MDRMVHNPAKIAVIQNVHRHDTPAKASHPDIRGPRDGPANGAIAKSVIPLARVAASQISPTRAPELEKGAAAKMPESKRKTMMLAVLRLSAQPTEKPV